MALQPNVVLGKCFLARRMLCPKNKEYLSEMRGAKWKKYMASFQTVTFALKLTAGVGVGNCTYALMIRHVKANGS